MNPHWEDEDLAPALAARNAELDRRLRQSIARFNEEIEKVNEVIAAEEAYLFEKLKVRLEARVLISQWLEDHIVCYTNLYYGKHEGKKFGLWIETARNDRVTEELSTRSYLHLRSCSKEIRMQALEKFQALREEILRVYEKATEDLEGGTP